MAPKDTSSPTIEANVNLIRQHLDLLAEPFLNTEYADGLIEIAYTSSNASAPRFARLFGLDELAQAAEFAASRNSYGSSIYVGAALRSPDADREKRASGADFYVSAFVALDVDENLKAVSRRMQKAEAWPQFTVQTGTVPEPRAQTWHRLDALCDDPDQLSDGLGALVAHTGADARVHDAARIMRLAGCLTYPPEDKRARGYIQELPRVIVLDKPDIVSLEALCRLGAHERREGADQNAHIDRDDDGLVRDGRETWFRNILLRHLAGFQREHGADPEPEELFSLAFNEFEATADNSDERWTSPHGQTALRKRVRNTLRRLQAGHLAQLGLWSYETGTNEHEARKAQQERDDAFEQANSYSIHFGDGGGQKNEADEWPGFAPWTEIDPQTIPKTEFLYRRFLARGYTSVTASPPKVGKSALALAEAIDIATGRGILSGFEDPPRHVLYFNAEDDQDVLHARVIALCQEHGIDQSELEGRLIVQSGVGLEPSFQLVGMMVTAGSRTPQAAINQGALKFLAGKVVEHDIDVVILDPLQDVSGADETNETYRLFGLALRRFVRKHRIAVHLVHHTRKLAPDQAASFDDMRGGSALRGTARFNRMLVGMTEDEAVKAGVEDHRYFFRIGSMEGNLAPPDAAANQWFEKVNVEIPNGDGVVAVRRWEWPDAWDEVTQAMAGEVRKRCEEEPRRRDRKAADCVHLLVAEVCGWQVGEKGSKERKHCFSRAEALISQWVASDVLSVAMKQVNGRATPFVTAGANNPEVQL